MILARSNKTHIWFILREIEIKHPVQCPYYIIVQYFRGLLNYHRFEYGSQSRTKILGEMTRVKIRYRENRKFLTGFWDTADFFTGNRDPIPPWWAPLICCVESKLVIRKNSESPQPGLKYLRMSSFKENSVIFFIFSFLIFWRISEGNQAHSLIRR